MLKLALAALILSSTPADAATSGCGLGRDGSGGRRFVAARDDSEAGGPRLAKRSRPSWSARSDDAATSGCGLGRDGDSAPTPQAPDRVLLKSGRVMIGHVVDNGPTAVVLDDAELGSVRIPRTAVRAVIIGGASVDAFPVDPPTDPGEVPESHMRWIAPRGDEDGGLETCTSRWHDPRTDTSIFLVGVVHIADPTYYEELQKLLDASDLVLFEGVGKGEASDAELASLDVMMRMQLAMRGALGLGFQKDHVDYDREFWVNSDVDYTELRRALRERSASLPTDHPVVANILRMALSAADGSAARRSPRLQYRLKKLMGPGLAQADAILQRPAFAGMRGAVIEHRNGAVMKDLDRELAGGVRGRWIAVFYGAGHLPDFAKRFEARGYEFAGAAWHRAWTVPAHEPVERFERRAFDGLVGESRTELGDGRLGVHIATSSGSDRYGSHDDEVFDGATDLALLVELFAGRGDTLDLAPDGWRGWLDSSAHPPSTLTGWPLRRIGAALFDADPDRRDAARTLIESLLGGAENARALVRHRLGVVGGSLHDLASLARVLGAVARQEVRGLTPIESRAVAAILFDSTTEAGRLHAVSRRSRSGSVLDFGFLQFADGESLIWSIGCATDDETPGEELTRAALDLRETLLRAAFEAGR